MEAESMKCPHCGEHIAAPREAEPAVKRWAAKVEAQSRDVRQSIEADEDLEDAYEAARRRVLDAVPSAGGISRTDLFRLCRPTAADMRHIRAAELGESSLIDHALLGLVRSGDLVARQGRGRGRPAVYIARGATE